MAIARNGSDKGSTSGISRRGFLKGTGASLVSILVGGSTAITTLSGCSGYGLSTSSLADFHRPSDDISRLEKKLYDGVMHFEEFSKDKNGASDLAEQAHEVRQLYEKTKKSSSRKERENLELLTARYTNLIAWTLVRWLPAVPDTPKLEALVRLDIAENIIVDKEGKKLLGKRRKAYVKAYEKTQGEINKSSYEDIKSKLLARYLLDLENPFRLDKPLEDLANFMLPFDDFDYAFRHGDLPKKEADKKSLLYKLYQEEIQKFQKSMLEFVKRNKDLGDIEEVKDEKEGKYRIQVNIVGVKEWVIGYNNSLASQRLDYGRCMNKIMDLAVIDKEHYSIGVMEELEELRLKLKTGLAWKEKEAAEASYQEYKNRGDNRHLADASAHALAAYLSATDMYDKKVFYSLHKNYTKQMNNAEVDKKIRSDAYTRLVLPYYLDELKAVKKKSNERFILGSVNTAGYVLMVWGFAAGGGGATAAGPGFYVVGGPI